MKAFIRAYVFANAHESYVFPEGLGMEAELDAERALPSLVERSLPKIHP
jgi:hypothetical protein